MDNPILKTPKLNEELCLLIDKANEVYEQNFDGNIWFGRCIFLSWYCELGTCKFCFRSTQKHKIKNPSDARRSIPSILAEAAMIKGFNWRLEFLTGGYGIYSYEEISYIADRCKEILNEKIWLNIGIIEAKDLKLFENSTQGIVSSIETIEPKLHKKICPDKPLKEYFNFMEVIKKNNFKRSITIIIGLGEKKEDFDLLKKFIEKNPLERITIYTLRPVQGTSFKHGPSTEDLIWWIAMTRISFPKIEIIVGSAAYRTPEISLILKAGANAFTKLPATELFNTKKARMIEEEVRKSGRHFVSNFTLENVEKDVDWENILSHINSTNEEKLKIRNILQKYLEKFKKNSVTK